MDPIRRRSRSCFLYGGNSYTLPLARSPPQDCSQTKPRRAKRRKTNTRKAAAAAGHRATRASTSLSVLLDVLQHGLTAPEAAYETGNQSENDGFESTMEGLLPEYLEARQALWVQSSDVTLSDDNKGVDELVRPLTRFEITRILASAKQRMAEHVTSPFEWLVLRKLHLQQERRRAGIRELPSLDIGTPTTLTPLDVPPSVPVPQAVLDALRAIQTTRYEHSFAARVYGHTPQKTPGLIAVDWESRSPWTLVMDDICAHHALAHPGRDQSERPRIPITYVSLQPSHLRQVHDLLTRVFWHGIDVSDTLHDSPERCTVIAMYGYLVVGAALLSSPQETYITYLAVRAGWENAHIATTMLYHLITLHPHRDITLHVSANNPAMLLYNQFGFKAEEFIAGFYEAYLDTHSRASKNAIRLRLRR
ncbi:hypothetical protein J3R82DRAFT_2189 [Butyriboletus roseoflavus]|nr:hypothetical protein J3R82DRAFT_2189 [Butyriboletus roseoflavus]